MIATGADILFTMLNSGRPGAIDACRARGVLQIGNVRDWTVVVPEVFIASAVADSGRLVEAWIDALAAGTLRHGELRSLGLEDAAAVRLAMAPGVPAPLRERVLACAELLRRGEIALPDTYDGAELQLA